MYPLVVDRVTKRYGANVAVNNVSFRVEPGRIFGILGPNGAGKTSTIRMVTHITAPDSGRITFGDMEVGRESQKVMGYLPEERGLYRKMKVLEQLTYFGQLKGLPTRRAVEESRRWLERFSLSEVADKRVEELSKGMQQKVQFIATILHDPKLCIFDEPFSGLDPINSQLLQDIILELRQEGRTILFASHRMEQVEQMCDDIFLIARGREVLHGTLRDVKSRFGQNTVELAFSGDASFLDDLEARGAVKVLHRTSGAAQVRLNEGVSPRSIVEVALASVDELFRFELVEPPLSEIFVMAVNSQEEVAA
ncbi:ATP-binding cassette domain-containing protein [soil metagenome]